MCGCETLPTKLSPPPTTTPRDRVRLYIALHLIHDAALCPQAHRKNHTAPTDMPRASAKKIAEDQNIASAHLAGLHNMSQQPMMPTGMPAQMPQGMAMQQPQHQQFMPQMQMQQPPPPVPVPSMQQPGSGRVVDYDHFVTVRDAVSSLISTSQLPSHTSFPITQWTLDAPRAPSPGKGRAVHASRRAEVLMISLAGCSKFTRASRRQN